MDFRISGSCWRLRVAIYKYNDIELLWMPYGDQRPTGIRYRSENGRRFPEPEVILHKGGLIVGRTKANQSALTVDYSRPNAALNKFQYMCHTHHLTHGPKGST
jgi:hypothetical protein